jgi:hypothetical protein
MGALVWDNLEDRTYENGIDRGVLYLHNKKAVPWNGLVSIVEKSNREASPVYFDGVKVFDFVIPGEFSGTISAYTYPDEFLAIEGVTELTRGFMVGDQPSTTFNLSYRTYVGNPTTGELAHYKIHILYNLTAIPSDKSNTTLSDAASPINFSWDVTAVPQEYPGILPTAHIILDSRYLDKTLLEEIELQLYGGVTAIPELPTFKELLDKVANTFKIEIIDNGDGTWTARSLSDNYIFFLPDGEFLIREVDAVYLDDDTYVASSTKV